MIEALIPLDSVATVRITGSKNYNQDNQYPPVEGATVTLSDGEGGSEVLTLMPSGQYESKMLKGVQGTTYHLLVQIGEKSYTATSTMPYAVPMEELTMFYFLGIGAFPQVVVNDPAGVVNRYRFLLFINGRRMPSAQLMDDEDTDGKPNMTLLFFESLYNDGKEIEKGDLITVEMQCIDEGAYLYHETLRRIGTSLTNPTSNISGGALGFFSAYTLVTKEIVAD